jgi:hypothetical protein
LRIRVRDVLELLAAGASHEEIKEILSDDRDLEAGDITDSLVYAARATDHVVLRAAQLNFLVHQQLPPALGRWLGAAGHTVEHVAWRRTSASYRQRHLARGSEHNCNLILKHISSSEFPKAQIATAGRDLDANAGVARA